MRRKHTAISALIEREIALGAEHAALGRARLATLRARQREFALVADLPGAR